MIKLPYSNSKANPTQAQQRIRQMLIKLGVDRIVFDEDFKKAEISVKFKYKNYPVSLPVNYGDMAGIYLKNDPWTSRKSRSRIDWEANKKQIAYSASYSLLEDFLKSLITIVELGVFSFEEIFVSYFCNSQGQRFGEVLMKKLPDFVSGKLALMDENDLNPVGKLYRQEG